MLKFDHVHGFLIYSGGGNEIWAFLLLFVYIFRVHKDPLRKIYPTRRFISLKNWGESSERVTSGFFPLLEAPAQDRESLNILLNRDIFDKR